MIQLSLTFFLIFFAATQLIYGALSERFGRRKILGIGLLIFIAGAFWSSITNSIESLLISRAIQGAGISSANVLCRTIMRDVYSGKELAKKVSYFGMTWVLSLILAPVIGGYVEELFGWRMNFIFLTVFVAVFLIWALWKLPETKDLSQRHSIHPKTIAGNYWKLLTNRFCLGYVLAAWVIFGMFSSFYAVGPFLLQNRLQMSPVGFGWTMLIIAAGYFLGSLSNAQMINRFSAKSSMYIGMIIIALSSSAMLALGHFGFMNISVIVLPIFLIFFGIGFIFTNTISGSLSVYPNLAGNTSALWGCSTYAGGALASVVMTRFETQDQIPLAKMLFVHSVVIAIVLIAMVFRTRPKTMSR